MNSPPRSTSSSQQNRIAEALILMAGSGSRLRGADETFLKPLVPILGRPLISYTIDAFVKAGIRKINAVVGFESERLVAAVRRLVPAGIEICFIENPEWQKQNGISFLAAKDYVAAPFLLTMSDHLFDEAIVDLLIESADLGCLNLAIDWKLNSIFDLDDAMKIQSRGDRVIAIGKNLRAYDAIDAGLFICPLEIFEYLERAKQGGNCSLADGVRLMAADNKVRAIDIGDAWWQDVDTPEMLQCAEKKLSVPVKS
jgi:1L-myo-inositol 1-phosphate cytidylyltransferase